MMKTSSSLAKVALSLLMIESTVVAENQYFTGDYVAIPAGKTDQNAEGYDLKGTFSTVKNDKGQLDLEI